MDADLLRSMLRSARLDKFVRESNRIEGIDRDPTDGEIRAHERLLAQDGLTTRDLERFVVALTGIAAPLRALRGMDVVVGKHRPPPGGPEVLKALDSLLAGVDDASPWAVHVAFEALHPFMDGNGRSGRALWAWQMQRRGEEPFGLPFLHRFYYQTLAANQHRSAP